MNILFILKEIYVQINKNNKIVSTLLSTIINLDESFLFFRLIFVFNRLV